jgi:hypothetical protein
VGEKEFRFGRAAEGVVAKRTVTDNRLPPPHR